MQLQQCEKMATGTTLELGNRNYKAFIQHQEKLDSHRIQWCTCEVTRRKGSTVHLLLVLWIFIVGAPSLSLPHFHWSKWASSEQTGFLVVVGQGVYHTW